MKKLIVCVLLAFAILLIPARTIRCTADIIQIQNVTSETVADELSVQILDTPQKTAKLIEQISTTKDYRIIFPVAFQKFFTENMTVSEMVVFQIIGYSKSYGNLTVTFEFPTYYTKDKNVQVVTVLGSPDDEETFSWWIPLVEVTDEWMLKVTFIDDLFDFIREYELLLIVFDTI